MTKPTRTKRPHDAPSEYDAWAPFYDLIHEGLPGEAEFYVGQAVRIGGATLELGCGTGRLAIPMALSGVDVTGLDNSPAMLALCREKIRRFPRLSGSLELVEADMRAFTLERRFRFIAMAYRTFMQLLTPEDQCACLECVHRHLADDGVFILNLWAARPSRVVTAHEWSLAGEHHIPDTGERLVHYHRARYDEDRQLIIEEHRIEERDHYDRLLRESRLPLARAWVTPREMKHLVRRCGFDVEAVFGDFNCRPFRPEHTEMIWVLRRTGT
ncbi:MAG TPA: class I SAM-dependent methyltransferase [Candidatus Hydrogenedentes bacterium]|nr:class I SAM-dependent methyltransferase [Candidatus Hydrogenedentota bacterium]HNT86457.1 class I SAM-dependent methyltransferase [Candidatus Hydrogenedentota bacterium]